MTHEKVGILRRFAAKPGARLSASVRVGPGGSERVLYMLAVTDDQGKHARLVVTEDFDAYLTAVSRAMEILSRARANGVDLEPAATTATEDHQPAEISAALPELPRLAIPARFAGRFEELDFFIAAGWGNVPSWQIEEIIANEGSLPLKPPTRYALRDQKSAIVSNRAGGPPSVEIGEGAAS